MRTYAIADIHGCKHELETALVAIQMESKGVPFRIVFLGDYIDRGPNSRGVVERIMAGPQPGEGEEWVALMGNHEWLMLAGMSGEASALKGWLLNGGNKTLAEYQRPSGTGEMLLEEEAMERTLEWMQKLPVLYDDGQRYFVHAMIDPRYPLDPDNEKQLEALLWLHVRKNHQEKPFQQIYGRQVVHGHSPQRDGKVFASEHRVNLDTGAVFGGALTYARWDDGELMPVIKQVWVRKKEPEVQHVATESA
ncbi:serine/threonine protein phosphatase protein [Rhizobium phage RHph_I4]|nr:serine/threonine protein phosphatase protein [Rhizobium phage RHph_I4]